MPRTNLPGWECNRCGYKWTPRIERTPKQCPACKSPYWNKPRISNLSRKYWAKRNMKHKNNRGDRLYR